MNLGLNMRLQVHCQKNQWRRIDIMQRQLLRSGDLQIRYRTWTTDCLVIRNFALWRGILESPKFIKPRVRRTLGIA